MTINLLTVKQLLKLSKYQWLTEPALRQLIFMANSNGLTTYGAILRLGRKILIDTEIFDQWVLSHRVKGD